MSEIAKFSDDAFVELSADEEAVVAGGWYFSNASIFFKSSRSGHIRGGDFHNAAGGGGTVYFRNAGGLTGSSFTTRHGAGATISGYAY